MHFLTFYLKVYDINMSLKRYFKKSLITYSLFEIGWKQFRYTERTKKWNMRWF